MPPRYAFRLEDLRVFHLVRASCQACGRKPIIPNATLLMVQARHSVKKADNPLPDALTEELAGCSSGG